MKLNSCDIPAFQKKERFLHAEYQLFKANLLESTVTEIEMGSCLICYAQM
jgi:hypothetical protein